ncbi:TrmH family RNA methyltransferase [Vibrio metschnikovii]|uniref:TrmH family RNA methyltransferase n=1 Tax=Vibrio metschnikovii TaxID=28172 RepID=UPI0030C6C221
MSKRSWPVDKSQLPTGERLQAIYLFGPEDGSLPQEVIDKAHHVVYIPTHGCMNLAATVNVVMYDRLTKTLGAIDDHTQVIAHRDNKNRLRVKES